MKDSRLKRYYDSLTPSEELKRRTIEAVKKQRRQRRLAYLLSGYAAAAVLCVAVGFVLNQYSATPGELAVETASVLSQGNGWFAAILLFALLSAAFTIVYIIAKRKDR